MHEREADVIVVGAGIMGASAAWQLERRGRRVLLFEQFGLEHVRGSSHGASRIFRLAYDLVDYVHLAQMALPLWREAEAELGAQLLWTTGGLDLGPPEKLAPVAEALTMAGVPLQRLSRAEIAQRFPVYSVPPGWEALYQAETGVLHADACRAALLELARRAGAGIKAETQVARLLPADGGVTLETGEGSYRAGQAVVATAAWANRLLEPLDLAIPMKVTREHVVYFDCPQHMHVVPFIWHTSPFEFYGLPNGRADKIKVGQHGAGPEVDPDSDPVLDQARLDSVQRCVREYLPALGSQPVGVETCLYASTPDDDFVLDRFGPIVLGIGFGGHGFKFGPAVGAILADLVQGSSLAFRQRFAQARFETEVAAPQ